MIFKFSTAYGLQQKISPNIFSSFLSNCLELKSQILRTYVVILHAHNSLVRVYIVLGVNRFSI